MLHIHAAHLDQTMRIHQLTDNQNVAKYYKREQNKKYYMKQFIQKHHRRKNYPARALWIRGMCNAYTNARGIKTRSIIQYMLLFTYRHWRT